MDYMNDNPDVRPDGGPPEDREPDEWAHVVGDEEQVAREMLRLCVSAPPGSHFERDGNDLRIWYPHPADVVDPLDAAQCRHPSRARSSPTSAGGPRARDHRGTRASRPPAAGDDPPPHAVRPGPLPKGRDAKTFPRQEARQPHGSGGRARKGNMTSPDFDFTPW